MTTCTCSCPQCACSHVQCTCTCTCPWFKPGCVPALIANGFFCTLLIISFHDLSTCMNILASLGNCRWISGAPNILSRYNQFLWHSNQSSYSDGNKTINDITVSLLTDSITIVSENKASCFSQSSTFGLIGPTCREPAIVLILT